MALNETQQAVLTNIIAIMGDSNLPTSFYSDVLLRLESLGYTLKETDAWIIGFTIQKVENAIKAECNVDSIPEGLYEIAIDMVCGEFLFTLKSTGQLTGFDLDVALKSVQAGDTNVTFAVGQGSLSPEQRLDSLLSYLIHPGKGKFVCYRKLKW